MTFFNFCSKCARSRVFFPQYFSCPFCRFSVFVFLPFSFIFSTLSRKWRRTLFVLLLRHLFLRYSGHLVREIAKLLKRSEQWVNRWSKVKTLEDKPRKLQGVDGRCFTNCVRNVIEKAVSICVIIQQDWKVKKSFNLTILKFRAQRKGDMRPTKVGKPWREKRRCTLHAGMASEEFANFNYTKGRPAGKLTWYEHSRDHLGYRWWDNIQRVSSQNTGRAKTAITLRLQKCEYRHALGARTFYTSPLRKCTET